MEAFRALTYAARKANAPAPLMAPGTRVSNRANDRRGTVVARPSRAAEIIAGERVVYVVLDGSNVVTNWPERLLEETTL